MKTIAIHQPNFFPWLGYFNKIFQSDVFVLLDDAQFAKTGGTWSNRVRIWKCHQPGWFTVPVDRGYSGVKKLNEIRMLATQSWKIKQLRVLEQTYSKTPYFKNEWDFVQSLFDRNTELLSEYNTQIIMKLLDHLELNRNHMIRSTELDICTTGTERLIDITRQSGGTTYLCGGGATGYQEDELFTRSGIELRYQNFIHPIYQQFDNDFIMGLSILDVLFHCGVKKTSLMITKRGLN